MCFNILVYEDELIFLCVFVDGIVGFCLEFGFEICMKINEKVFYDGK